MTPDNHHPINPPPELVQQWYDEARDLSFSTREIEKLVATRAAQWGYQQAVEELEAFLRKDHDKG